MKLVVATFNRDKFQEISEILDDLSDLELIPAFKIKGLDSPKEVGLTLVENAVIKAYHCFERTGMASIADDTGLVVDGLHGMPGVFSSRFAGNDATYEENRKKLLRLVDGLPLSKRRARFVTIVAFVDQNGSLHTAEGTVEGFIIQEERGANGFGYDPIFLYPQLGRTFAELPREVKNRISHRRRAFEAIKPFLKAWNDG